MLEFKDYGLVSINELDHNSIVFLMMLEGGWKCGNLTWTITMHPNEGFTLSYDNGIDEGEEACTGTEYITTLERLIERLQLILKGYSYE
jgi:hypothetical protein